MSEALLLDNSKDGAMPWLMAYMDFVLATLKVLAILLSGNIVESVSFKSSFTQNENLLKQILVSISSPPLYNQQCGNVFPTFFDFGHLKQLFLH